MKKIVAFGDSFVNNPSIGPQWVDLIGQQLKRPVLNLAAAGSSLQHAVIQLIKYTQSADYDSEDIVIFVLTSSQRIYTKSMPNPMLGIIQWAISKLDYFPRDCQPWIRENADGALWAITNLYDHEINFEEIKTISFVDFWSRTHRKNNVVLLNAFNTSNDASKDMMKQVAPTATFFPLLSLNQSLFQVSVLEHGTDELTAYNVSPMVAGDDQRTNHLSTQNLEVLASMVADVIQTKNVAMYDVSRFKKHFL